jgi:uncharacterized protein involved in exopolysaccharide biosynthesis
VRSDRPPARLRDLAAEDDEVSVTRRGSIIGVGMVVGAMVALILVATLVAAVAAQL